MDIIDKRAEMAKEHIRLMKDKYTKETKFSIRQSKIYSPNSIFPKTNTDHFANLSFKNLNSAHAANELKNNHPHAKTAILNFADYLIPGGLFLDGAAAQEEVLCHESNLYLILTAFNEFYQWNRKHADHHLYKNRAIYSPDIIFTNLDGSLVNKFDVITCAAPNYNSASFYDISYKTACNTLKNRMYFVKDIAEENHVDNLILGAWGAGAFGFHGNEVAKMWHQAWSTPSSIKNVCFAVIEHISTDNVKIFKSEFS